jgi:hypothetical protein
MKNSKKIIEQSNFKRLIKSLEIEAKSEKERFLEWYRKLGGDVKNSEQMCNAVNKIIEF